MTDRTASRLAWGLALVSVALSGAGLGLRATSGRPLFSEFAGIGFVFGTAFPLVGAVIAGRQPRNAVGWIFVGLGAMSMFLFFGEYARYGLVTRPGAARGAVLASWLDDFLWVPGFGLLMVYPLVFPNGRPPSARWRGVLLYIVAITAVAMVARAWGDWPYRGTRLLPSGGETPFTVGPWHLIVDAQLLLVGGVASVASLVFRVRRASPDEREQIRWVAFATLLVFVSVVTDFLRGSPGPSLLSTSLLPVIPIAAAIAILKYRLYDIDLVINKTVVFGALAALFTLVYVAVVVGIGTLVGSRSNSLLTIAAAVVIAVAFEPVRLRAQHLANRLVYGKRASPYQVLSEFSERVSSSYWADDVLPQMARVLGEGTGARRSQVWLKVGDVLQLGASWPLDYAVSNGVRTIPSINAITDMDRVVPVLDRGETLGALAVAKPPGEGLTPTEAKLLADLAAQAGLMLKNVRLIEEVRASRARLVKAQDEERRRLERNIHDGAQQELVALSVKLRLLEMVVETDAPKAKELATQLQGETQDALENLRDLARGIYPPLLRDRGLLEALEAQVRKVSLPVHVDGDGIPRYPQEVEAAVYFCVLEALQNVAKYAKAQAAKVGFSVAPGKLEFTVSDNGMGFDATQTSHGTGLQGMADRLEALGGTLEVDSTPGSGTTVRGRLPVRPLQPWA
jgi:signal transduction histidine kinase